MSATVRFDALHIVYAESSGNFSRAAVFRHTVTVEGVCVCISVYVYYIPNKILNLVYR